MKNLTKKHKAALVIGVIALLVNLLLGGTGVGYSVQTGLCLLALVFIYTDKVELSRITYGVALIICVYGMRYFFLYSFLPSLFYFLPFITIVISLISTIKIKITTEENESGTIKMMNFYVNRQKEYSRGYLLLRGFFGFLYIGIPHGFLLLFLFLVFVWQNMITFWIILFTGKYPYWSWN